MEPTLALLFAALRRRHIARAADLTADLGVSQPSLARLVQSAGDAVVFVGRARRARYALARSVRGLAFELPVFSVDETGRPSKVGRLRPLEPEGSLFEPLGEISWPLDDSMRDGLFPGLPYFIADARPQGFLGRSLARQYALSLRVPEDPNHWSDDDVLMAAAVAGCDWPGNLIVGEASLEIFQRQRAAPPTWLDENDRTLAYPSRARAALAGEAPGSSAGGEFAKFTAAVSAQGRVRHVIVKFSPADESAAAHRWADLLIAEHHARAVLPEIGVEAAQSQLLVAEGRHFLEVERFDRVNQFGRRAVVTLAGVEPALLGLAEQRWETSAAALHARNWLSADDVSRVARLALFGRFIGNSDMHNGNLAFFVANRRFALAPAYDMLPMWFAPTRAGELIERPLAPSPPPPAHESEWHIALAGALQYWAALASNQRVSADFRAICRNSRAQLLALGERFV